MKEITTRKELQNYSQKGTVLLYFRADWCGHCHHFLPTLQKVYNENPEKFEVLLIDVDHSDELNEMFEVMSIPTLVLFKDGKGVKQNIGGLSERDLIKFLEI